MPTTTFRTLSVSVTPEQSKRAVHLASARMLGHNHCRTTEQEIGAGGSANWLSDWIGALGEVVVVDLLIAVGIDPKGWVPIGDRSPAVSDFQIGALSCDVKATPPGRQFWNVNEKQFQRRASDMYIPVQFINPETALIYKGISQATIARWPVRSGHSQYRGCPVSTLHPIRTIDELFG